MVRTTSDKQISRTFQRFFKDKLQFFKGVTKDLFNKLAFFNPIDAKWLGMTCNFVWGTEIAFEKKEQKWNVVHAQKCSNAICELNRFLHQGWAKFSLEKGVWRRQGCMFQGLFKTKYRNQDKLLFKDLNWILGLFKTTSKIQDLFKIVESMLVSAFLHTKKRVAKGEIWSRFTCKFWQISHITCFINQFAFEERNRNKILFIHKNVLALRVSLITSSYTKDEPNFPQKKVSYVDKVVYFKDFSRRLVKFKSFSRL